MHIPVATKHTPLSKRNLMVDNNTGQSIRIPYFNRVFGRGHLNAVHKKKVEEKQLEAQRNATSSHSESELKADSSMDVSSLRASVKKTPYDRYDPAPSARCLTQLQTPCGPACACGEGSVCNKASGHCQCKEDLCGLATGICTSARSQRPGFDFRIAPRLRRKSFLRALQVYPEPWTDQKPKPPPELQFVDGWPADTQHDAIWTPLLQPDKRESMLLSTWLAWEFKPPYVLDLNSTPPYMPIMAPLKAAGQAEWQLELSGPHQILLRHVRTGRYLSVAGDTPAPLGLLQGVSKPQLTLESSPGPIARAVFDLWPPYAIDELNAEGNLRQLQPEDFQDAPGTPAPDCDKPVKDGASASVPWALVFGGCAWLMINS